MGFIIIFSPFNLGDFWFVTFFQTSWPFKSKLRSLKLRNTLGVDLVVSDDCHVLIDVHDTPTHIYIRCYMPTG